MNLSKSKVLLKKINALHESAESFDQQLSDLEKDLLLQYLRELYSCVLSDQDTSQKHAHKKSAQRIIPPSPPIQAPIAQNQENGHRTMASVETVSPPIVEPSTKIKTPQPKKSEKVNDPDLEALFAVQAGGDRAHIFGNAPITDIGKSMGINDRILTINELFKGDQQLFEKAIRDLNNLSSFDQAKKYLMDGMAASHKWGSDKKRKKAEVFIKLVRRRYQ